MTLARSFSLNLLSKSPCCSTVIVKFEYCNLQHCKKKCCKLVFRVFTEQLTIPNNFGRLHCYGVTLVNKFNKLLLQTNETKIFGQKRFIKDLFKVNEKNNSGVWAFQIMSKFLTLSKHFQLNCYSCLHCYLIFWTCRAFSHFTFYISLEVLYYNWSCFNELY